MLVWLDWMLNPSQKRNLPMVVFVSKESRLPLPWKVAASGFFCLVISSSCPAGTNSPVVHESKSAQASETTALWELSLRVAAVDPGAH